MTEQMMKAIEPKSDQINADDLIGGDMVVTVKSVKVIPDQDQPVQIRLVETEKFFRPCKSMSRVMVALWGPDPDQYVGKSMRLYRDPEVKWGGMKVGGIRISEMSDIENAVTMPLTEKRGLKKMVSIRPLSKEIVTTAVERGRMAARAAALLGSKAFTEWWNSDEGKAYRATGDDIKAELKKTCAEVDAQSGPSKLEQRLKGKLTVGDVIDNPPMQEGIVGTVPPGKLTRETVITPEYDESLTFPMEEAFQEGAGAFRAGEQEDGNPYDANPAFSNWIAGWRGARKAAE